jgi:hypothetical protein
MELFFWKVADVSEKQSLNIWRHHNTFPEDCEMKEEYVVVVLILLN